MSVPMTAKGIDPGLATIPFWRTVLVELRKAVGTRGPWIVLGVMALVWCGVGVVGLSVGVPASFGGLLSSFGLMTRIFVGVLAILLVTTEWGQRSVVTTFALEPRRERVILAKLSAALLLAVAFFAVMSVLATVITALRGGAFDDAARALRGDGVRTLFDVLMAFAIALAVLNTAGAMVTYLVLPEVIVPTLLFLGSLGSAADRPGGGLYGTLAPWVYPREALAGISEAAPGAQDWAQVLVCAVIWIGLPGVLGVYRVMTAEVK
ncbi:ABC transporter permease [Gordonia phosphorivorans]|uniref:ABC transporter permease n=1 Tax=Gordonia phosphorivorans TaxID=1056982 RepID=A0ABV6H7H0_9ACTN